MSTSLFLICCHSSSLSFSEICNGATINVSIVHCFVLFNHNLLHGDRVEIAVSAILGKYVNV